MPQSILLIEDNDSLRQMLEQVLRSQQYEVLSVANGSQALEALESFLADVILLDLMMPVMNGWEFLEHKKQSSQIAGIPVIVMSGTLAQSKEVECTHFLAKPVGLPLLLDQVKTVLATPLSLS